jgi:hypothetical protein
VSVNASVEPLERLEEEDATALLAVAQELSRARDLGAVMAVPSV